MRRLLLLLFALTGAAALIYEIVWLQLLELVIGSSATSIAVLLGTFMGGMCLGSLLLPRVISARRHPLRVYAVLELIAAFFGFGVLYGLPRIQGLYAARGPVAAICLLLPTMPMGATLPALSRYLKNSWTGYFYAANIAGGVVGCLIAGFWLLRVFDMAVASYVAVGLNLIVAAVAWAMAGPYTPAESVVSSESPDRPWRVYTVIGLSGLTALGAEVLWTRLLALTLGPTVYTFSIILAVFLIGLGLGSGVGSALGRRGFSLGWSQALLVVAIAWAAYTIGSVLPYWDRDLSTHANPWRIFALDFLRSAIAILPAAILWGASFPLALAAARAADSARLVGQVYAANTLGAIVGAVGFSLIAIPQMGSTRAESLLIGLAAFSSLVLLPGRVALVLIPASMLLAWVVPGVPWQLIAFGRRIGFEKSSAWKKLYVSEGMNSSIAYTEWVDKTRYFHVAGKIEASSNAADMKLQRMLGHLPALLNPNPKSVLIVGCGAGVTAGTFVLHPEVERIELCEIEPRIPPATARFFAHENYDVMKDRRTSIVFDDARHFVLTTPEKFDIITSDPIHPWVKGAATLYSKEYFGAVKAHLKPGGLVTQWVPLYESDRETVRSEVATFAEVFPNSMVFGNLDIFDRGYDVVLLGSVDPIIVNLGSFAARLAAAPAIEGSLKEVTFRSGFDLLGTYTASAKDLSGWLKGAQINRDLSLRLEFLAGMSVSQGQADFIYAEMERLGAFPEWLFRGSAEDLAAVRKAFGEWRTWP